MKNSAKNDIETALEMLARKPAGGDMARVAAAVIVSALYEPQKRTAGSEYYRIRAEDWLSLLLTEPYMTLAVLAERVAALSEVSPHIKTELGALPCRLMVIAGDGRTQ